MFLFDKDNNLSQKLEWHSGRLISSVFVEYGERTNQWYQDFLHGGGKSEVGEQDRQDRH